MANAKKAVITCAMTGVLTDPKRFSIPVTPEELAQSAKEAYDAGASIMHVHIRNQEEGLGHLPSWDPEVAKVCCDAIRDACPDVIINLTTGVIGDDISGPVACLESVKPEMAALNAGSLNYLRARSNGTWAWPPMLFDNPIEKIEAFIKVMDEHNILPECECFDTGIVRSVGLLKKVRLLKDPVDLSIIMGVASGMPAKAHWLPLLQEEIPEGASWQVIGIGRQEVWDVHKKAAELGANLRTGLEDTFYLRDGSRATSNAQLIEEMVKVAQEVGRDIASPQEAREIFGFNR